MDPGCRPSGCRNSHQAVVALHPVAMTLALQENYPGFAALTARSVQSDLTSCQRSVMIFAGSGSLA